MGVYKNSRTKLGLQQGAPTPATSPAQRSVSLVKQSGAATAWLPPLQPAPEPSSVGDVWPGHMKRTEMTVAKEAEEVGWEAGGCLGGGGGQVGQQNGRRSWVG